MRKMPYKPSDFKASTFPYVNLGDFIFSADRQWVPTDCNNATKVCHLNVEFIAIFVRMRTTCLLEAQLYEMRVPRGTLWTLFAQTLFQTSHSNLSRVTIYVGD